MTEESKEFVMESEKRVPVYRDLDVAVAGAGTSGVFAGIASARYGAKTILIDRFGALGGNIGPAMVVAGSMWGQHEAHLPGGVAGLAKEFKERVEALEGSGPSHNISRSFAASFVLAEMARESGLELLLSAYAADPIMEGKTVRGVFVETCSGRVAIRAKVVVDATGQAAVAARAGAPVARHMPADPSNPPIMRPPMNDPQYEFFNDTHLLFLIAGVDYPKYQAFGEEDAALSEDDAAWAEKWWQGRPKGMAPAARQAFGKEGFKIYGDEIEPKVATYISDFEDYGGGVVSARVAARGEINCDDAEQMSRLEASLRKRAYRAFHFFKQNAPGFEDSYLVGMSNFLGMRGGPCIDGEHMITIEELMRGQKFDDVICRSIAAALYEGEKSGHDIPYRAVLPKGVEGLLVAGRGMSYFRRGHDPGASRSRPGMMVWGQAVGTAAAMAAGQGIAPGDLDVKELQRELLKAGFNLGPEERLHELGLV